MFVVDLECALGHTYEEWYENGEAFGHARDSGELACPACGSREVTQRLTFRGVMSARPAPRAPTRPAAPASAGPPAMPIEVQKALSALLKAVRTHTEDVGEAFADKAIAIHRGDEEARPIHGTSTPEDEERLVDEGVPFAKIPIPDIDQN